MFEPYDFILQKINAALPQNVKAKAVCNEKYGLAHMIIPCPNGEDRAGLIAKLYALGIFSRCEFFGQSIRLWLDAKTVTEIAQNALMLVDEASDADGDSEAGYVIMKMKTLAKKPRGALPQNDGVLWAVWLALCIFAFGQNRVAARVKAACKGALDMFGGLTQKEKTELRNDCGLAGKVIAAMIYKGNINTGGMNI